MCPREKSRTNRDWRRESAPLAAAWHVDRQHDKSARDELFAEGDDVVRRLVPAAPVLQEHGRVLRPLVFRHVHKSRHASAADALEFDAILRVVPGVLERECSVAPSGAS